MEKESSLFRKLPVRRIILILILLYLGTLIVPYIPHKKISASFQEKLEKQTFYGDGSDAERITYIEDNTEALLYRIRMIEEAQDEIIFSTFDFNADTAGKDVMALFLDAADRGVKVSMIVDGISGFLDMRGDPWFQALAAHENISVKVYNPVNFLKPWDMQARLHDKYLIVDQKMYLLGGRNTTNLFLGDYSSHQNLDRELFVYEEEWSEDSSVAQLLDYFSDVWDLPDSKDYVCRKETDEIRSCAQKLSERARELETLYLEAYGDWNWEELTFPASKVTLLSNPIESENKEPWMWHSLTRLMDGADNVTVYTPYIICGKEMYDDLTDLTGSGTQIDIITNDVASGANPWGCTDYMNQKEKIWSTGVNVYEFMGAHSCHTKAFLIDDRISVVGSYNMGKITNLGK